MPVPQQPGTATAVVSTGTYDVARFGIEGQSVRAPCGLVKPKPCDIAVTGVDLAARADYSPGLMPSAFANAVHVPRSIFSFAKFAAFTRS